MPSHPTTYLDSAIRDIAGDDKHCVFRIGSGWFSIPATAVREIVPASEIVSVPASHRSLAGLCHVRSEFVPVLRLGALLQEPAEGSGENQKVLVIEGAGGHWALLVDEVVALESLETLIHPDYRSESSQSPIPRSPILGTATCRDQIVRVLDPNGVFRLAQQFLLDSWQILAETRRQLNSTARNES